MCGKESLESVHYTMEMGLVLWFVIQFIIMRTAMGTPLGGRWMNKLDMYNSTQYGETEEDESNNSMDQGQSSCFQTEQECNLRCPVSCREVNDCGGVSGVQYACSWDLIIIAVAVGVLACVLILLCFLTWKQRQARRTQLEQGRVDSSENLLRRYSRQRAGSIFTNNTLSSPDASGDASRRSSYDPPHGSPVRMYPHYL